MNGLCFNVLLVSVWMKGSLLIVVLVCVIFFY